MANANLNKIDFFSPLQLMGVMRSLFIELNISSSAKLAALYKCDPSVPHGISRRFLKDQNE